MKENNFCFIDGQNLNLGTPYSLDFQKFRTYLKDKYKVTKAYYFLGCVDSEHQDLYSNLQEAGYILIFREHNKNFKGLKKGNVDTDIVFEIMKSLIEKDFNKVVLVSGDGDYKKVVDYLIKRKKFKKIIFPNFKKASSLYKQLTSHYFIDLNQKNLKKLLKFKKQTNTS